MAYTKLKKSILALLALAILAWLILSVRQEAGTADTLTLLSQADYQQILSQQEQADFRPSSGKLLIQGEAAPFDAASQTYYIPQSLNTSSFDGQIRWDSDTHRAYLCPDALSSDKLNAIECNHSFTLLVTNGSQYQTAHLIYTGLPAIVIQTESVKSYMFDQGLPTGEMVCFDPAPEGYTVQRSYLTYHSRGNTTAQFDKTPLRLQLYKANKKTNKLSLLGLRQDDDWILNSLYTDSSKLRDAVSVGMWNRIAAANPAHDVEGTHFAYVEVFKDDEYMGLYGLMEPIGKKASQLDTQTDILYQAKSFVLRSEDFAAARKGLVSASVEIAYPYAWTGESLWDPITEYVNAFWLSPESYSYEDKLALVDLENTIDHSLFLQAATLTDNFFHNNFYLAKPMESGWQIRKIPWDMNYSFGDKWAQNALFTVHDPELITSQCTLQDLITLMEERPEEIIPSVTSRWKLLRSGVLSDERILADIDGYASVLLRSGAFARDGLRWPGEQNDTDSIAQLRSFAIKRLAWLDAYYAALG